MHRTLELDCRGRSSSSLLFEITAALGDGPVPPSKVRIRNLGTLEGSIFQFLRALHGAVRRPGRPVLIDEDSGLLTAFRDVFKGEGRDSNREGESCGSPKAPSKA